jgi:dienelactone hydrolase
MLCAQALRGRSPRQLRFIRQRSVGLAASSGTLTLIGDTDDRTPVRRRARWRDAVASAGYDLRMMVYPGALHAFDALPPLHG